MAPIKHIFNELHYEMTRKIGEGRMGIVYEAMQLGAGNFRKVVAVKLIREEFSAIEEFRNNFIGEARLAGDLIHTNIVQTYCLGQVGGQYFMVTEFVWGVNLEQFIEQHRNLGRPVPRGLAVFIVSQVARGLAYAHSKRDREGRYLAIVHQDIGPKNIMIAFEGDVKLTDFGIVQALDLMYKEEGTRPIRGDGSWSATIRQGPGQAPRTRGRPPAGPGGARAVATLKSDHARRSGRVGEGGAQ